MHFIDLPTELLLQITSYITDPLDLLDLRLTHPRLNHLLTPRFNTTFPPSAYCLPDGTCASSNHLLFWVSAHNHPRLLRHIIDSARLLTKSGMRQACIHAARSGQIDTMAQLLGSFTAMYGRPARGVYMDCFDAAVPEKHDDVAITLAEMGLRPSWRDDEGAGNVVGLVVKHHQLKVLDSILASANGPVEGQDYDSLSEEDLTAIWLAMNMYISLMEQGPNGSWCQRILYALIREWEPYYLGHILADTMIEVIGRTEKRECGTECDVWFRSTYDLGERRVRLGCEDMVVELQRLQRWNYGPMVE